jgi:hypothetical protein
MHPTQIVREFRDTSNRHGARAALYDLRCRAVNHVLYFDVLRAMRVLLAEVPDAEMLGVPGFEARFASARELKAAALAGKHDFTPEFLDRARTRGDRCYGVFDGGTGTLAAHTWYAEEPTPIDEHYLLHFDPAYTYAFKGYTLPEYRGKRLHALGMCRALRALNEEGKKGLIAYVASNNFASLRSTARMGYQIFGTLYLARGTKHALALASGGCLPYGVRVTVTDPGEDPLLLETASTVRQLSWQ